jgi:acyl-CoA thioesterase I
VVLGLPRDAGLVDDGVALPYWGADAATVAAIREHCRERVRAAAADALGDDAFARTVAELPFAAGERVVAFGDSFTDDLCSWAYLLAEVLRQARPHDAIEVVNVGRSGDTSADLLQRFVHVAQLEPQWVIAQIGTNDAKQFRMAPGITLVSPEEVARSVEALGRMGDAAGTRMIWMTPPGVDERRIAECAFWDELRITWTDECSNAIADAIRHASGARVDLAEAFAAAGGGRELLMDDGLHPTLLGQTVILRALCARLVGDDGGRVDA